MTVIVTKLFHPFLPQMSGMIAFRTITYFLITSLLSATVGLILVVAIQPGKLEGLKATLGNGEYYPLTLVMAYNCG